MGKPEGPSPGVSRLVSYQPRTTRFPRPRPETSFPLARSEAATLPGSFRGVVFAGRASRGMPRSWRLDAKRGTLRPRNVPSCRHPLRARPPETSVGPGSRPLTPPPGHARRWAGQSRPIFSRFFSIIRWGIRPRISHYSLDNGRPEPASSSTGWCGQLGRSLPRSRSPPGERRDDGLLHTFRGGSSI